MRQRADAIWRQPDRPEKRSDESWKSGESESDTAAEPQSASERRRLKPEGPARAESRDRSDRRPPGGPRRCLVTASADPRSLVQLASEPESAQSRRSRRDLCRRGSSTVRVRVRLGSPEPGAGPSGCQPECRAPLPRAAASGRHAHPGREAAWAVGWLAVPSR